MGYLIGADIGTTGTKTLLCDESGAVLGAATVEFPLASPVERAGPGGLVEGDVRVHQAGRRCRGG